MPVNRCSAKIFIFDECIRQAKRNGTIVRSLLDVAKPFDTVPHEAILRALSSQRVDVHIIEHINDMYSGISMQINGEESAITLVRGVMHPLTRDLQRKDFRIGGHEIGALAIADILLAGSIEGPMIM
jgi:hypothetical protein